VSVNKKGNARSKRRPFYLDTKAGWECGVIEGEGLSCWLARIKAGVGAAWGRRVRIGGVLLRRRLDALFEKRFIYILTLIINCVSMLVQFAAKAFSSKHIAAFLQLVLL
jgi:hypothetical protein